jgi:hypothetical protein
MSTRSQPPTKATAAYPECGKKNMGPQPKLRINGPGDACEEEVKRVTEVLVKAAHANARSPEATQGTRRPSYPRSRKACAGSRKTFHSKAERT